jgi:L-alanine-DL-glutamate epimerase-like enolase superfamily enzyme
MREVIPDIVPFRIPMDEGAYEGVLLVLEEDGVTGLGEAPALAARGGSVEALWAELREGRPCHPAARSAWECAHLDLEARRRGVPMVELLGGRRRSSVDCNALVSGASPTAVARSVEAARTEGFTVFKLKAAGLPVDFERLGAARWEAGPKGRLRLDCNQADYRHALHTLAAFDLELCEQPLAASAEVAAWPLDGPVRLAADESLEDPERAGGLAGAGAVLACKLATVGGPGAALDLLARSTADVLVSSSYETSIGLAAALAVACALPREPLACGLATRRLLDGDLASGLGVEGPRLRLPAGPGLGVTLDRQALEHFRIDGR